MYVRRQQINHVRIFVVLSLLHLLLSPALLLFLPSPFPRLLRILYFPSVHFLSRRIKPLVSDNVRLITHKITLLFTFERIYFIIYYCLGTCLCCYNVSRMSARVAVSRMYILNSIEGKRNSSNPVLFATPSAGAITPVSQCGSPSIDSCNIYHNQKL